MLFNGNVHQILINRRSKGISLIASVSIYMIFEFWKQKMVKRGQVAGDEMEDVVGR